MKKFRKLILPVLLTQNMTFKNVYKHLRTDCIVNIYRFIIVDTPIHENMHLFI